VNIAQIVWEADDASLWKRGWYVGLDLPNPACAAAWATADLVARVARCLEDNVLMNCPGLLAAIGLSGAAPLEGLVILVGRLILHGQNAGAPSNHRALFGASEQQTEITVTEENSSRNCWAHLPCKTLKYKARGMNDLDTAPEMTEDNRANHGNCLRKIPDAKRGRATPPVSG